MIDSYERYAQSWKRDLVDRLVAMTDDELADVMASQEQFMLDMEGDIAWSESNQRNLEWRMKAVQTEIAVRTERGQFYAAFAGERFDFPKPNAL